MKKIFLCLCLLVVSVAARSQDLVPFKAGNNLYGYKDTAGNVVLAPAYSLAERFQEGLALVVVRRGYGFIAPDGKMVIAAKYNYANGFKDGVTIAQSNQEPLVLNTKGEEIVKPGIYTQIALFSEGLAAVSVGGQKGSGVGGKWGYINTKGELVIPATYQLAAMFQNGRAFVQQNGKFFHIDQTGKTVK